MSGPPEGAATTWTRSTFCGESTCVEVAVQSDTVLVRDGKAVGGPHLAFTSDEWSAFVRGVKNGEFDLA